MWLPGCYFSLASACCFPFASCLLYLIDVASMLCCIVLLRIQAGAAINGRDAAGRTALMAAVVRKQLDCARYIAQVVLVEVPP